MTTRPAVHFVYTPKEHQALLRDTHDHDVEQGGRDDARGTVINMWLYHWAHPATHEASGTIGTFSVHWDPPALSEIETDDGFALEDLRPELGHLEKAMGGVPRGEIPLTAHVPVRVPGGPTTR